MLAASLLIVGIPLSLRHHPSVHISNKTTSLLSIFLTFPSIAISGRAAVSNRRNSSVLIIPLAYFRYPKLSRNVKRKLESLNSFSFKAADVVGYAPSKTLLLQSRPLRARKSVIGARQKNLKQR